MSDRGSPEFVYCLRKGHAVYEDIPKDVASRNRSNDRFLIRNETPYSFPYAVFGPSPLGRLIYGWEEVDHRGLIIACAYVVDTRLNSSADRTRLRHR